MRIWQMDPQFRTPYDNVIGFYYWTNTFYCDHDAGPPYSSWGGWNEFLSGCYGGTLGSTQLVSIRCTELSSGIVAGTPTPTDNHGEIPDSDERYLINTARLVGYVEGVPRAYKRWRFPLRKSDINGDRLSSDAMDIINSTIITHFTAAGFTTRQGDVIDSWSCDGLIHPWQMRHGTKRCDRVVYVYP